MSGTKRIGKAPQKDDPGIKKVRGKKPGWENIPGGRRKPMTLGRNWQ